jgi:hypothetical protein
MSAPWCGEFAEQAGQLCIADSASQQLSHTSFIKVLQGGTADRKTHAVEVRQTSTAPATFFDLLCCNRITAVSGSPWAVAPAHLQMAAWLIVLREASSLCTIAANNVLLAWLGRSLTLLAPSPVPGPLSPEPKLARRFRDADSSTAR